MRIFPQTLSRPDQSIAVLERTSFCFLRVLLSNPQTHLVQGAVVFCPLGASSATRALNHASCLRRLLFISDGLSAWGFHSLHPSRLLLNHWSRFQGPL